MASKDNKKVTYTIDVDVAEATAEVNELTTYISQLETAIEGADKRTTQYKNDTLDLVLAQQKLKVSSEKLSRATKASQAAHANSTKAIQMEIARLQKLRQSQDMSGASYKKLGVEITNLSNKMNRSTGASGAATSSVMELSRVASDAPYGIRGMANNLSQLTQMMFYATEQAGGLGKALKSMGKAMLGPLGIIFLITSAIALLDYMSQKTDKAKKAMEKFNGAFGEGASKIMVLKSALDSNNLSIEAKNELIKKSNEEFSELNTQLDENGDLTIESANALNELSLSLVNNAKARALLGLIQEEQSKKLKLEAADLYEHLAWYEEGWAMMKGSLLGYASTTATVYKQTTANRKDAVDDSQKTIDKYVKMMEDGDGKLAKLIWGDKKKGGAGKDKEGSEQTQKFLDLSAQRKAQTRKELLDVTIHEEDKRKMRQEWAQQDLRDDVTAWQKKETLRLQKVVEKQVLRKKNNKDDEFIQADADRLILQAQEILQAALIQSEKEFRLTLKRLKQTQNTDDDMSNLDLERLQNESNERLRKLAADQGLWITEHNQTKKLSNFDNMQADLQSNIDKNTLLLLAEEKYGAEYIRLKEEIAKDEALINENAMTEEMRIQRAKALVRNQLFDATKSSFGSLSKLMKKNSDEQKAFALLEIATGTAQGFINGLKIAQGATTGIEGPPKAAAFAVFFAQQTAAVLGAAAQAKSILAGGSGSASQASTAATPPAFKPEFNVVGNSNENQLAQGIGGQMSSPTRAYVVYEDIEQAGNVQSETIESSGI